MTTSRRWLRVVLSLSVLSLAMFSACGGTDVPVDVGEEVLDVPQWMDCLPEDGTQDDIRGDVPVPDVVGTDDVDADDAVQDADFIDDSVDDTTDDIDTTADVLDDTTDTNIATDAADINDTDADAVDDVAEICGAIGEACCDTGCDDGLACLDGDTCGCPFGLTDCDGECVSARTNLNCGECRNTCATGTCADVGTCSPFCGSANGEFNAPVKQTFEWSPFYLTVADMDKDGSLDLVFIVPYIKSVNVMFGDGSGFFGKMASYEVAEEAAFVTVADLNGDTFPDVVVTSNASNCVSILLGVGDGTLLPAEYLVSGGEVSSASSAVIADFDGDTIPDMAVANMWSQTISIWIGNGDGTFGNETMYPAGYNIQGITGADFNGDSKLDLAVANYQTQTVGVFLGNGDATFQAQASYAVSGNPGFVAAGDVNGDGNADIISAAIETSSITIWLGNGDGTFAAPAFHAVDGGTGAAAVADVTGDGIADVVSGSYNNGRISLLRGQADGSLAAYQSFVAGGNLHTVTVADLNADGLQDVVSPSIQTDEIWFMFGRQENFQAPETYMALPGTSAFALADMDADGDPDMVAVGANSTVANVVLMPRHQGAAIEPEGGSIVIDCMGRSIESIALAYYAEAGNSQDCNYTALPAYFSRDVTTMFVAACVGKSSCSMAVDDATMGGDPGGTTAACLRVEFLCAGDHPMVQAASGAGSTDVATADFDADGKLDFVTVDSVGNQVNVVLADAESAGAYKAPVTYATGTQPMSVAVGDVTGDGNLDIVTANATSQTVTVLFGNGDGTFKPGDEIGMFEVVDFVTVGDLTGDGLADIVASHRDTGSLLVIVSIGAGEFGNPKPNGIAGVLSQVLLVDVDGDDTLDAVVNDLSANLLVVLTGAGNGLFNTRVDYPTGLGPVAQAAGDVNGDGMVDLVTANINSGTVSVLLNNGAGKFRVRTDYAAGAGPTGVAISDLDGDGRPDLIVTGNSTDGDIRVLRGTCTL